MSAKHKLDLHQFQGRDQAGGYLRRTIHHPTNPQGGVSTDRAGARHRASGRDGTKIAIPIGHVRAGEIVIVRPGEQIPVDCTVIAGHD